MIDVTAVKPILLPSDPTTKYIVFINSLWATSPTSAFYVNCSVPEANKTQNGFQVQVSVSS